MARDIEQPDVLYASDTTADKQVAGSEPPLVRETRQVPAAEPADGTVIYQDSGAQLAARRATLRDHHGGIHWGSAFIGFAVASFFVILFLGIVGAIVGAVGFQLNTPVPKVGGTLSQTTQNLGIGALAGSLIAVFLAFLLGGYTAGRMARFDGAKNGVAVWIWTIVVAILLGVAGGILGSSFNVASQIHLKVDTTTVTTAGAISLAITLIVTLVAAMIGGMYGERYHRRIDREMEAMA